MNRTTMRRVFGAAAAAAMLALGAAASAHDLGGPGCRSVHASAAAGDGLTRQQVRDDLARARALGLLDRPGEAGADDAVVAARERENAFDALAIEARERLAADGPDLDSYVEEGEYGPRLVVLIFDADGAIHSIDAIELASID